VSELALAAFAAETGSHLVHMPRDRRFRVFARGFDETGYLTRLRESGVRWVARSASHFPPLLHAIHDPPAGLFVRGAAGPDLLRRATVAVVGAPHEAHARSSARPATSGAANRLDTRSTKPK